MELCIRLHSQDAERTTARIIIIIIIDLALPLLYHEGIWGLLRPELHACILQWYITFPSRHAVRTHRPAGYQSTQVVHSQTHSS